MQRHLVFVAHHITIGELAIEVATEAAEGVGADEGRVCNAVVEEQDHLEVRVLIFDFNMYLKACCEVYFFMNHKVLFKMQIIHATQMCYCYQSCSNI